MRLFVDLPQRAEQLVGVRGQRQHNKFVKDGMRAALQFHHATHIPRHFLLNARNVYGHMERKRPYKKAKAKKMRSVTDLVYTGETEKMWKTGQGYKALRVGGQVDESAGRPLTGSLTYSWSFTERVRQHMQKKFAAAKFSDKPTATEKSAKRFVRRQILGALDKVREKAGVTIEQMKREVATMIPAEQKKIADVLFAEYWKKVEALRPPKKRVA